MTSSKTSPAPGRRMLAAAAACCAFAALPALADTTPTGTASCSEEVSGCSYAADRNFPAEGQQWQDQTAWWTGTGGIVTVDFGQVRTVTTLRISLDNNDSYAVSSSTDGASWTALGSVAYGDGNVGWGMDTFSSVPGDPEHVSSLAFAPVAARYLRVVATDGDGLYSVGEVSITAVPEPASALMLAGGLALVAAARRRR